MSTEELLRRKKIFGVMTGVISKLNSEESDAWVRYLTKVLEGGLPKKKTLTKEDWKPVLFSLKGEGFSWGEVQPFVADRITPASEQDYNDSHRLEKGKSYTFALVTSQEILEQGGALTVKGVKDWAIKKLGENSIKELKAETIFLMRKEFSNKDLRGLSTKGINVKCLTVLHEPLFFSENGLAGTLCIKTDSSKGAVQTNYSMDNFSFTKEHIFLFNMD